MADDKLDSLMKKRQQIDAQIASVKAKASHEKRKLTNKAKILTGAMIIDRYEKEGRLQELYNDLDNFLTRPNDRKVLPLIAEKIAKLKPKTDPVNERSSSENTSTNPTT